jgi:hypothetical protein
MKEIVASGGVLVQMNRNFFRQARREHAAHVPFLALKAHVSD